MWEVLPDCALEFPAMKFREDRRYTLTLVCLFFNGKVVIVEKLSAGFGIGQR